MPLPNEVVYRDFNTTFNPHPVTGRLTILENNDSVERALRNIMLTNKYERPYQPELGANIVAKLFEPLDAISLFQIQKEIEVAIKNFEPRVEIIQIKADKAGENGINVTLVYSILNQANPVTTTFFLERVR